MSGHETGRNRPVYSVGDSAFQASIINEKVPCEKRCKQKSVSPDPFIKRALLILQIEGEKMKSNNPTVLYDFLTGHLK